MQLNVDDVGYVTSLIALLETQFPIDRSRIYITGASNGGMMTYRMLCEMTSLFAAGAPVIANMPTNLTPLCSPSAPIPMLILNGEEDPLMPWDGGDIGAALPKRLKDYRGTVESTDATVAYWAGHDQCQTESYKTYLPDTDPNDGTRVWYVAHTGGVEGAEVILYGVEGGGHAWPGGSQYLPESVIGKVSHDIDATQLVWDFFKTHARN
jgi:polyhydroxybutyrate depolymerase